AVGAERHGGVRHGGAVLYGRGREDYSSVPRVPDLDGMPRTFRAARRDALAVGVPGHAEDNRPVAGEYDDRLPRRRGPDPHVWAMTGRDNPLTVGAHRHTPDFLVLLGEGEHLLALVPPQRGGVPDADGPVEAGRGEAVAVRAEGDTPARGRVPAE